MSMALLSPNSLFYNLLYEGFLENNGEFLENVLLFAENIGDFLKKIGAFLDNKGAASKHRLDAAPF